VLFRSSRWVEIAEPNTSIQVSAVVGAKGGDWLIEALSILKILFNLYLTFILIYFNV